MTKVKITKREMIALRNMLADKETIYRQYAANHPEHAEFYTRKMKDMEALQTKVYDLWLQA